MRHIKLSEWYRFHAKIFPFEGFRKIWGNNSEILKNTNILLFTIDSNIENEILLGFGIAGMGLMSVGFWFYHNKKGIDDGNSN